MNNEPVACDCSNVVNDCSEKEGCCMLAKLNTHPAKTLTDEEIAEVYEKCEWASGYVYWKEFARAILKKASEK